MNCFVNSTINYLSAPFMRCNSNKRSAMGADSTEVAMCRYSLEHVSSRDARLGETVTIGHSSAYHVPAMVGDDNCVVCIRDETPVQINGAVPPGIGITSGDLLIFTEYGLEHSRGYYYDGFRTVEGLEFPFNALAEQLKGRDVHFIVAPDHVTKISEDLGDPVIDLAIIAYDAATDAIGEGVRVAREHAGTTLTALLVIAASIGGFSFLLLVGRSRLEAHAAGTGSPRRLLFYRFAIMLFL